MTTKQAIEQVLRSKRKPTRVTEIIDAGVLLATELNGKTPGQVFYSVLYGEAATRLDAFLAHTECGS